MRTFVHAALLLLAGLAATASADDHDLQKSYSDEEIVRILNAEGYGAVRIIDDEEDRLIEIKVDGSTYIMQILPDDDLLLYFGMTGFDISLATINEWNAQRRLVRAYIDFENDPVLEGDLLANAGYTPKQLTEFLKVFVQISREFRDYLIQNDGAGNDDAASTPTST